VPFRISHNMGNSREDSKFNQIFDGVMPETQSRSRLQSQDISRVQNQQNSGFSQANFDIPACFKIDLDSLPEEKRKKMEEKPSDYFNYGILKC